MDRKTLLRARDKFRELIAIKDVREKEFQRLFSEYPFILSHALPLALKPSDIVPLGRPGKAEVDFLIKPEEVGNRVYGSIEIKRPSTKILAKPRKGILRLTSEASTALAQGQKFSGELGDELNQLDRPLVDVGKSEYVFLILGMQTELQQKISTEGFKKQFLNLLPSGCFIIPYDTLLSSFEESIISNNQTRAESKVVKREKSESIPPIENQAFWQLCANDCARYANVENFSSRRGTYPFVPSFDEHGESVLCIYNNNPYASDPLLREDETNKFRQLLREEGIKEIAYATYPKSGEDAGYSYAMFIDVSGDDIEMVARVHDHLIKVTDESSERIRLNL